MISGAEPRTRFVLAIAFALHVAITLWTALHHEAWFDEADPWLLMRDADVASIFQAASNGGVPLLYHFCIWPFARFGAPYVAQQLLNLAFVWAAVAMLFRSRAFPALVKVLFAFSYYPAFEYSVVPRPYGLAMLLTFAVAESWRDRVEKPWRLAIAIALLANTSSHGLMIAAIAGAIWLIERLCTRFDRQAAVATAVMICGGLISVAQLWPREGRQHVYTRVQLDTVWYTLASAFFPDARISDAVGPAIVVLAFIIFGISRRWQPVAFVTAVGTALMLVFVFVWMGGLRHAGVLFVVVVAAIWIADAYGPYRRERLLMAALAVSLAYSIWPAYDAWIDETRFAFSGSREVAAFIRRERLDRVQLVSHPMFWTSPLVYLPGVKLWYPANATYHTYSKWERSDYELSRIPLATVLARVPRQMEGRRWVLILNRELPTELKPQFRLIFETRATIWRERNERYWIYVPRSATRP